MYLGSNSLLDSGVWPKFACTESKTVHFHVMKLSRNFIPTPSYTRDIDLIVDNQIMPTCAMSFLG